MKLCKATIPVTEYMSRIEKVYDFASTYLSGVYDYGEATEENIGKWILETVPSDEYIDVLFFEDEEENFVDFLYTTKNGFGWSNDHEDFLQNRGLR